MKRRIEFVLDSEEEIFILSSLTMMGSSILFADAATLVQTLSTMNLALANDSVKRESIVKIIEKILLLSSQLTPGGGTPYGN